MKKKELISLRTKKVEELKKIVFEKKQKPALNKNSRREIAQILTVIKEKEILEMMKEAREVK